ncbi:MAG: histidine phosphatase family protein [Oscillospiraceae bacterium]|nr:histidine phosphatase family protein [Oscillospiraceae bacterium]
MGQTNEAEAAYMRCLLVRHGKDDDTLRGGWSAAPLTPQGVQQVQALAAELVRQGVQLRAVYASDLPRAMQTAEILAAALGLGVTPLPALREVNNGLLAGMKNEAAESRYPGLYWSTLAWEQPYPEGESPQMFYSRVSAAWQAFKAQLQEQRGDIMLVSHAGVFDVIRCVEAGVQYTNKRLQFPMRHAEAVWLQL